ncbi:MAG: DUF1700 domain-containing protein [Clostridia bacterium]|nr:DUF1700 domain-containing protein [Clostridia bacterium]
MNKQEFFEQLRKGLSGLPKDDIEERLTFYKEMIEDRIEDGLSEEDAVSAVGEVNEIVSQIAADIPLTKIAKERIKIKRRLSAGEIVLLVLGSPIWLSLGIAAFAIILSLYISLWAIIISLWAVFGSLVGCAFGGVLGCAVWSQEVTGLRALPWFRQELFVQGFQSLCFMGAKRQQKAI